MTPRNLVRSAAFTLLCLPAAALAADIVIAPPASGGVTITNAAGNATRFRVADDGTVTLPGLTALPVAGTGLCIEIATGKVGTCPAGGGSGGTVTSLIAGTGLTGGTITTAGTIGIANGGVGTAQLADRSVTLAKIAANDCLNGQVLQFGKEAWTCGTVPGGSGTVTNIATGTGLTGGPITASGTVSIANSGVGTAQLADLSVTTAKLADGVVTAAKLAGNGCTTDQILKYNGSVWVCAADANSGAPLPTVLVASVTTCCAQIISRGEANAVQMLLKSAPASQGKYLARLDAQLNNFAALYFDYFCKLQALQYPYFLVIGAPVPWADLPATRREVSWRTGKDNGYNSSATGISISMQAPVTAGTFGVDVRMVCWGEWDGSNPPIIDYGLGLQSAVLTLLPVGAFN